MTYNVSMGTLNPTIPYHTLTQKLTQAKYHESKWLIFCTIQYNSIYLITFGR